MDNVNDNGRAKRQWKNPSHAQKAAGKKGGLGVALK